MTKPRISIIVAHAKNNVIGKANKLPWHITDDLKRFKSLTIGHPIIMGRKTYESIGKPLSNRTNIVITRNSDFQTSDIVVCKSLEEALEKARGVEKEEIFVIGGGEIYKQALPLVDRLYITKVDLDIEGDTYFPEYKNVFTKQITKEDREENSLKYSFLVLEK